MRGDDSQTVGTLPHHVPQRAYYPVRDFALLQRRPVLFSPSSCFRCARTEWIRSAATCPILAVPHDQMQLLLTARRHLPPWPAATSFLSFCCSVEAVPSSSHCTAPEKITRSTSYPSRNASVTSLAFTVPLLRTYASALRCSAARASPLANHPRMVLANQ